MVEVPGEAIESATGSEADAQGLEPLEAGGLQPLEPAEGLQPLEPAEGLQPLEPAEGLQPLEPAEGLQSLEGLQPIEDAGGLQPLDDAEGLQPLQPASPPEATGEGATLQPLAAAGLAVASVPSPAPPAAPGHDVGGIDDGDDDFDDDWDDDFDEEEEEEGGVFGGKPPREESEMDMTPMVDVTFLLLIFFMVTAAFSLQKSIQIPKPNVDEPSTTPKEEQEDTPDLVTVQIDEYNTFTVITPDWEREAPGEIDLLARLREARQGSEDGIIPNQLLVKAHGDCLHKWVVMALDGGSATGFDSVQLMTVEDDF